MNTIRRWLQRMAIKLLWRKGDDRLMWRNADEIMVSVPICWFRDNSTSEIKSTPRYFKVHVDLEVPSEEWPVLHSFFREVRK